MIVIGLTGSIATGKSFAANLFRRLRIPVFDADKTVHKLFENSEVIQKIAILFPEAIKDGKVDRKMLGKLVFQNKQQLSLLEQILHPKVQEAEEAFLKRARMEKKNYVVLDIPLLFETEAEERCDKVLVMYAPFYLQVKRALQRPGMTKEKLLSIKKRQMSDHHKRRKADKVIISSLGKAVTTRSIKSFLKGI